MAVPILLAASGTSTRAAGTYRLLEEACLGRFPGHEVHWAYSSDRVRELAMARHGIHLRSIPEALSTLAGEGHRQAVVQSVHLICGEEFHRVVRSAAVPGLAVAIGLPLLSGPADLQALADALAGSVRAPEDTLSLLVGHGTGHPAGMIYDLLNRVLQERFGDGVQLRVLQGSPSVSSLVDGWPLAGRPRVRLMPFMLVAGAHAAKDIDGGGEESVRQRLERKGASVDSRLEGLLECRGVREGFLDHIARAMDGGGRPGR